MTASHQSPNYLISLAYYPLTFHTCLLTPRVFLDPLVNVSYCYSNVTVPQGDARIRQHDRHERRVWRALLSQGPRGGVPGRG